MANLKKAGTKGSKSKSDKIKKKPAAKVNPPKHTDVMGYIKNAVNAGALLFSSHCNARMAERGVLSAQITQALLKGHRVPSRDRYSEDWQNWEYTVEGKSVDKTKLRIGVAFHLPTKAVVCTVIKI